MKVGNNQIKHMLTPPPITDQVIIETVHRSYNIKTTDLSFLPLGADLDTAVYRLTSSENKDYFLKLRRGSFAQATVSVPYYLASNGTAQIIPPFPSQSGQLYEQLDSFTLILYPFIVGYSGADITLTDEQWHAIGAALKALHSAHFPVEVIRDLPQETFSSPWPEKVRTLLAKIAKKPSTEPIAKNTTILLRNKQDVIISLIDRVKTLAAILQKASLNFVVCHADLHGWNLLVDEHNKTYIIDWDTLIRAPKERDLMFIGAGISPTGRAPLEEVPLFYEGYGPTTVNQDAIAYYRYARIIEDIGSYVEHIFFADDASDEDRAQSLVYLKSNFAPDGTIERAHYADNKR